ncbi:glutamine amidotransferase subunit PdxT [Gilliamella sp. Choc4-2]|jgi:pyridoxal 5'-phosphate synthase pdxT subunit|uniref:pyridoxal 5'-phosphate synthase glutaminase subunit PdxT n=1 Tax=unclassified Gilliamella TaxID=2685620 RepID=UPI0004DD5EAF|nr:pyridoxal 5'-phosphate synthase glutaminase subunit PdxT [Gilliamella apicola]KFA58873.1 Pyridoxine biosynthesis glutamine amidotransferase, glutaminase subunit [Gilliamella apicola]OCG32890.1 glutamine amidotransferase subunit PdxT [Gilliamella apicola]OCG46814.1 glutamine amidotransferase subunit PdxT [Gilliamella apicola]OCG56140.1 glutamine amidotransferase subunit PdxT [Gilliamella apicola]OCG62437.1 glutamine amidotransferase subunit PdxT [Gilliamella apicola]
MAKSSKLSKVKYIGVLNLQGAVSEHISMLNSIDNVQATLVQKPEQLANLDGLIIPGGESTTISRLIKQNGLIEPIKQLAKQGKGVLGTCAGLVLCGKTTTHNEVEQLGLIDISVERNGFGRQINSFETLLNIELIGQQIPAVFIRAPYIIKASKQVKQLAFVNDHCVMAQQDNILVCSFHPELTVDNRIMRYFIDRY